MIDSGSQVPETRILFEITTGLALKTLEEISDFSENRAYHREGRGSHQPRRSRGDRAARRCAAEIPRPTVAWVLVLSRTAAQSRFSLVTAHPGSEWFLSSGGGHVLMFVGKRRTRSPQFAQAFPAFRMGSPMSQGSASTPGKPEQRGERGRAQPVSKRPALGPVSIIS